MLLVATSLQTNQHVLLTNLQSHLDLSSDKKTRETESKVLMEELLRTMKHASNATGGTWLFTDMKKRWQIMLI